MNSQSRSDKEVTRTVIFFNSMAVFRENDQPNVMNELILWSLVEVKKDFSIANGSGKSKNMPKSTHEQKLLEMNTKESNQDVVIKGKFQWILGEELAVEDDGSVNGTEDLPELVVT